MLKKADDPDSGIAIMHLQFAQMRKNSRTAHASTYQQRRDILQRLLAMTKKYEADMCHEINQDFGTRSAPVSKYADILLIETSVRHHLRHLKKWMRTKRIRTPLHLLPARSRLIRQPLGVVGIVSPWNFPYQLSIGPAVAALAAGNRVMIKPSELTPSFSALLAHIVSEFFSPDEMLVITGEAELGKAFCALPFDHLVFTGSTAVGRHVAQQAGANLTPCTLELGGKSPCIIDDSFNFGSDFDRFTHGKLFNAGQICVAPDYVLIRKGREKEFAEAFAASAARLFPTLENNADYTSIVSERHFDRLLSLMQDAIEKGAEIQVINPAKEALAPAARKMAPTLLFNVDDDMKIMQEEIFGPLLPVVAVADLNEAIDYINCRERPLALYWFGYDHNNCQQVLEQTISGGVSINDTLMHVANEHLPFGGVGSSGYGAYHGDYGFRSFSKEKPIFIQSRLSIGHKLFPPYGSLFDSLLNFTRKII